MIDDRAAVARAAWAGASIAARLRGEEAPELPTRWQETPAAPPAVPAELGAVVIDLGLATDRHRALLRKLYRLQEAWRPFTIAKRLIDCGRVRVDNCVDVERLGAREKGSTSIQFRGLKTCRTKACPVCYQRRKAKHNAEASAVILRWRKARGTDPLFATLTVKHAWSDSLETTGRGIRECFRLLQQDRHWRRTRQRFGLEYLCAMEITHGPAGFHPHLHVAILSKKGIGRRELSRMRRRFFKAWGRIVVRQLGEAYRPDLKGFDLRRAKNPAEYMTKLGLELTDPTLDKEGRHGGRSMIQILGDLAAEGADRDRAIYAEYEAATRKQRDLTYSGGLRELRAEIVKEQKAERKALARELICRLPYDVWDRVQMRRRRVADDACQLAALLGAEYRDLRAANEPVIEQLRVARDLALASRDVEAAAVAAADLARLSGHLAEARRRWLLAREQSLHDPRAEIREHADVNLDAVCRLIGAWFPGTDAVDRVRDWTAEELRARAAESEGAGPAPPPVDNPGPEQLGLIP